MATESDDGNVTLNPHTRVEVWTPTRGALVGVAEVRRSVLGLVEVEHVDGRCTLEHPRWLRLPGGDWCAS